MKPLKTFDWQRLSDNVTDVTRTSMKTGKRQTILYFLFPLLAILACNAPVDEIFPLEETPTVIKPTIGPPPTLTPITLEESEYIIVTETPDVSLSLTPTEAPPTPVDTPTPSPTATLIPTVTLNPNYKDQEEVTPQAKNTELIMGYSIDWTNSSGRVFQATYYGQVNLVAKGGVGDYQFFSGNEPLEEGVIPLAVDNCEEQFYKVSVQSGDLEPVYRDVKVTAPCLGN